MVTVTKREPEQNTVTFDSIEKGTIFYERGSNDIWRKDDESGARLLKNGMFVLFSPKVPIRLVDVEIIWSFAKV